MHFFMGNAGDLSDGDYAMIGRIRGGTCDPFGFAAWVLSHSSIKETLQSAGIVTNTTTIVGMFAGKPVTPETAVVVCAALAHSPDLGPPRHPEDGLRSDKEGITATTAFNRRLRAIVRELGDEIPMVLPRTYNGFKVGSAYFGEAKTHNGLEYGMTTWYSHSAQKAAPKVAKYCGTTLDNIKIEGIIIKVFAPAPDNWTSLLSPVRLFSAPRKVSMPCPFPMTVIGTELDGVNAGLFPSDRQCVLCLTPKKTNVGIQVHCWCPCLGTDPSPINAAASDFFGCKLYGPTILAMPTSPRLPA